MIVMLGMVTALTAFATDMYTPALPIVAKELSLSIDDIEATISFFILGLAVSQLFLGALSDRVGRANVIIVGFLFFTLASFLCAIATQAWQFQTFRFIQALGGGASVAVFPIVTDLFDKRRSTQVISYIIAILTIAPIIAPLIGSQIILYYSWQAIFYILGLYSLIVVFGVWFFVRKKTKKTAVSLPQKKTNTAQLITFFRSYLIVLQDRYSLAHIFMVSFAFAGFFSFLTASPFVYITYYGINEQQYAYFLATSGIFMALINIVNAKILYKIEPINKAIFSAFLFSFFGLMLFLIYLFGLGFWWIACFSICYTATLGFMMPNTLASFLSRFKEKGDSGTANSVFGFTEFFLAFVGSYLASVTLSKNASPMLILMSISALATFISVLILMRLKKKYAPGEQG